MNAIRFLLVLLMAVSSAGYAQPVKVTVTPVPVGTKTQLPIRVTGLPSPAPAAMELVADVEILGSDGRTLGKWPRCCTATVAKGANASAVEFSQTVIMEPEAGRRSGSWTVKVSVTDGQQTWTGSEVVPYGETEAPGTGKEAPRLRMNVPAGEETADRRDCLGLATPAEVIKCSEKKR
jgi:hypothetical protein